jgi:hypothetical protein
MISLDLFCEDERKFTPHIIEEIGNIQTIRCLICGNERKEIMFRSVGININLKKEIWEAFLNEGRRGEK